MPKIVDKEQKRKDIAFACKELFFQKGINDLTISEVAKTAGVGKGTIYEYFNNKEDIIFEIVHILMLEHNVKKEKLLSSTDSTKEKVKHFFDFFYNEEDVELRQLYKEFISISLMNPQNQMISFQTYCFTTYYQWLEKILQEGIDKKEIKPEAIKLAKGLFLLGDSMLIASAATTAIDDIKEEIDTYIDTLFTFILVEN
jgi:AcrR family transcriptional regulator